MKEKTIEKLEKELEKLKESNKSAWDTYGSELCAGDMIGQEKALEKEIQRKKSIKRWKDTGILDGLEGDFDKNCARLFKPQQSLKLDDNLLLALIGGDGKRVTVRQGRRDIQLGELVFIGTRDNGLRYIVMVTEVGYLRMVDMPEDVVKAEGFKNWTDFYEDLKKFYPNLDVDDECTIIFFK